MIEEVLVTPHYNPLVGPHLGIWDWRVAVYLYLGGLSAGMMLFTASTILLRRDDDCPFAAYKLPLLAPIVLSIGMTTLFLDLEHKLFVWRFYTAFRPASVMSWGSWILLLIYPFMLLQIASTLRQGYPALAKWVERLPLAGKFLNLTEARRRGIAAWSIPFAVGLGIYTGMLLGAFNARPFWNTSILGPLFLISGLSTAAALNLLLSRSETERLLYSRIDVGVIVIELIFIGLLIFGLTTGGRVQQEAIDLILGGPFTLVFWALFVGAGLLVPLSLEVMESKGGRTFALIAAVLVLLGGYLLRQVTVEMGQESTWNRYDTQYNPELLDRLEKVGYAR
jgi:protein NrfD